MATATTNGSATVIKPDHLSGRKHFIFTDEHEALRESMQAWVRNEVYPPQRMGGDLLAQRGDEARR